MILLWIVLALALTAFWFMGLFVSLVMGMDDDSPQTRVAQIGLAMIMTALLGAPAFLTWRHIAGFER